MSARPLEETPPASAPALKLAGHQLYPLTSGALWWAEERTLIVSDLHLEKGSSYAAQGQMLPPYDTRATLTRLANVIENYQPDRVISLGDSFHDGNAQARLAPDDIATIRGFTTAVDWVWVEGNHDPDPPTFLGGRARGVLTIGGIILRHEPSAAPNEIAGHLHPAAKVRGRGRSIRRRCFVSDGTRIIIPAFGAYAGGLNVLDTAFKPLFPEGFIVYPLGRDRIYAITPAQLAPDGLQTSRWRL